jgi:transposase-like protein
VRIDETYIKIRGQWRYLYRAIDKHGKHPRRAALRRCSRPR